MQLVFSSEVEASKVAEQLYNCSQFGKIINTSNLDIPALDLAVSLAAVKYPRFDFPIVTDLKCLLPFPRHERECISEKTPKIYAACLSAYNSGYHHGLWIDASQDAEDISDDIKWMLSWSPVVYHGCCEEWAIHDYEGFGDIRLDENEDIEYISKLGQILDNDYEGFGDIRLDENEDIEYISKLGQILDNADDVDAMCAWLSYAKDLVNDCDIEELAEEFNSYYCGHWDSERDFVYKSDEVEELLNLSEFEKQFQFLSFYIDWDGIARDLFIEGYDSVKASPYGIYVFREYHG